MRPFETTGTFHCPNCNVTGPAYYSNCPNCGCDYLETTGGGTWGGGAYDSYDYDHDHNHAHSHSHDAYNEYDARNDGYPRWY